MGGRLPTNTARWRQLLLETLGSSRKQNRRPVLFLFLPCCYYRRPLTGALETVSTVDVVEHIAYSLVSISGPGDDDDT